MEPDQCPTVASFGNDTDKDITLYREVVLSPGQQIDLLARPSPDLLPITIHQVAEGTQVFPHREFDPDWHVRFGGKILRAGHPLRLADLEAASGD